jgi:hypothetical protein
VSRLGVAGIAANATRFGPLSPFCTLNLLRPSLLLLRRICSETRDNVVTLASGDPLHLGRNFVASATAIARRQCWGDRENRQRRASIASPSQISVAGTAPCDYSNAVPYPLPGPDPGIHLCSPPLYRPNNPWVAGSSPATGYPYLIGKFFRSALARGAEKESFRAAAPSQIEADTGNRVYALTRAHPIAPMRKSERAGPN